MTNGDAIRQRINEELAEIKSKLSCELCAYANTGCKSGVLAGLNAPAKEAEE